MPTPTTQIYTDAQHLAGNPVMVRIKTGPDGEKAYFLWKYNTETSEYDIKVYEGKVFTNDYFVWFDIASLFAEYIFNASVNKYSITISEGGASQHSEFTLYGGGISKLAMRRLAAANTNIFTEKLDNQLSNFFLTTRTADRIICIPENELLPLYFYSGAFTKKHFTITADGTVVAEPNFTAETNESLQSIDFAALRLAMATDDHKLVSVFEIKASGEYACTVVITQADRITLSYLRFRNSWGVEEKIAISPEMSFAPEFSDPETIDIYDSIVEAFVPEQQERKFKSVFEATAGYRSEAERLFLLDMLRAKNVILEHNGTAYAVNVTTTTDVFSTTEGTPVNVTLRITLVDDDSRYTPEIHAPAFTEMATSAGDIITVTDDKTILV